MANAKIGIDIVANDKASEKLRELERNTKRLSGKFKFLGGTSLGRLSASFAVVTAGIASIISFAGKFIGTVREQEKQMATLKTATVGEYEYKKSLNYALELSKKIPISLEKILYSITALRKKGLDPIGSGYIPKLADISAGTGVDLSSTVDAFSRIMVGDYEGLKKFHLSYEKYKKKGVMFTYYDKEMQKRGISFDNKNDSSLIIDTLINKLYPKYKGGAENLQETYTGVFTRFSNSFSRLINTFLGSSTSKGMISSLNKLADAFDGATASWENAGKAFQRIISTFATFGLSKIIPHVGGQLKDWFLGTENKKTNKNSLTTTTKDTDKKAPDGKVLITLKGFPDNVDLSTTSSGLQLDKEIVWGSYGMA